MRKVLFASFLFIYINGKSQTVEEIRPIYFQKDGISINSAELETKAQLRVNLLDHFFDRLNMTQNIYSEDISTKLEEIKKKYPNLESSSAYKEVREEIIYTLLDFSNEGLNNNFQLIADQIVNKTLHFGYESNNWYAVTKNTFLVDGMETDGYILLQVFEDKNNTYRWSIIDTSLPFQIEKIKEDSIEIFLQPMSHETGFINLKQYFNETYKSTSLLNIQIQHTHSLSYLFKANIGLTFVVSYFNRRKYNSGWLIENLYKNIPGQSILKNYQSYLKANFE